MKTAMRVAILTAFLWPAASALGAPVYNPGLAPADPTLVFGDHLVSPQPLPSVGGVGGNGISNAGDTLDGLRTYTFDLGAQPDLTDGVANRGDAGFAMLIWDMGQPFDSMRLYTHQDHYAGGPITTNFVAQDVMEYGVWGSTDGDNFVLLSDVLDFDIDGGGAGLPTYTFAGTEPTIVYRGGSTEFGVVNAYTREYVFPAQYQFYGIRTSQISLTIPGGGTDADPEIDAIAAFNTADRCEQDPNDPSCLPPAQVAEPPGVALMGLILGCLGLLCRKRHSARLGR